jgi:hypothetical protein
MYIVKRHRAPWEGFLLGPAQPLGGPVQHDSSVTTEQDLFVYHYYMTTFFNKPFLFGCLVMIAGISCRPSFSFLYFRFNEDLPRRL